MPFVDAMLLVPIDDLWWPVSITLWSDRRSIILLGDDQRTGIDEIVTTLSGN